MRSTTRQITPPTPAAASARIPPHARGPSQSLGRPSAPAAPALRIDGIGSLGRLPAELLQHQILPQAMLQDDRSLAHFARVSKSAAHVAHVTARAIVASDANYLATASQEAALFGAAPAMQHNRPQHPSLINQARRFLHTLASGHPLRAAGRYMEAARWQAASVVLYAHLDGARPHPPAYHQLGLALLKLEKWQEAEAALRTFVAYQPQLSEGHYLLACALFEQQRDFDALACLRTAVELTPSATNRATWRAIICKKEGRYEDALSLLHGSAEGGTSDFATLCELGDVYACRGNHVEALQWYRSALEKQPSTLRATIGCALAEQAAGDVTRARELLSRYPGRNDQLTELRKLMTFLANPYLYALPPSEFPEQLRTTHRKEFAYCRALSVIASDPQQVPTMLQQLLAEQDLDPRPLVHMSLLALYWGHPEAQQLIVKVRSALSLGEHTFLLDCMVAFAALAAERGDDARARFVQLQKTHPGKPEVCVGLGMAFMLQEEYGQAEKYLRMAKEASSIDLWQVRLCLGLAQAFRSKFVAAITSIGDITCAPHPRPTTYWSFDLEKKEKSSRALLLNGLLRFSPFFRRLVTRIETAEPFRSATSKRGLRLFRHNLVAKAEYLGGAGFEGLREQTQVLLQLALAIDDNRYETAEKRRQLGATLALSQLNSLERAHFATTLEGLIARAPTAADAAIHRATLADLTRTAAQ